MPQGKKPQDHKTATAWKNKSSDLTCPSGQLCRVRRPGVQGLIKANVLESFDQLTSIVANETIPKAEGSPVVDATTILRDPEKLNEAFVLMDKIVVYVVLEPEVLPAPASEDERDDDLVYVDEIDIEDKAFIMNFAIGGSRDLERFREGTEEALGGVPAR